MRPEILLEEALLGEVGPGHGRPATQAGKVEQVPGQLHAGILAQLSPL